MRKLFTVAVLAAGMIAAPAAASASSSLAPPPAGVAVGGPLQYAPAIKAPVMGGIPRNLEKVNNGTYLSGNWSGYMDLPNSGKSFSSVSATFTIPKFSTTESNECRASGAVDSYGQSDSSYWVGIDGFNTSTVEQTGVDQYCTAGGTGLYAWYEMYPLSPVAFTGVRPGDQIYVSVTYSSGTHKYALYLKDKTNGGFISTSQSCPSGSKCVNTSAEVIAEAPGGGAPSLYLANFGNVSFSGAVVKGSGVTGNLHTSSAWKGSNEIIMGYPSFQHMATPSGLNSTGTSFSAAFNWPY
jgi:Peptidase A4 family